MSQAESVELKKGKNQAPEAGKGQWCSIVERWCLALGGVAGVCPLLVEEKSKASECEEAAGGQEKGPPGSRRGK